MTRILLVEDDRQMARTLGTSLQARGYQVLSSLDGAGAIGVLVTDGADLIVLDLGLPDIDGLDLLERIRTLGSQPVIVLTVRE